MIFILIIVISVASALAFLNVILLITVCLLRRRGKEANKDDLGSLEDRLSPIKRRQPPKSKYIYSKSLQDSVQGHSTPPNLLVTRNNPIHSDSIDIADLSLLKPPSSLTRDGASGQNLGIPSVSVSRRTTIANRTEETASIYSAESAPLHLHDQISNPALANANIARSNLPRGMDLPSTITRDVGLFLNPNRMGYAPFRIDNVASTTKPLNIAKKRYSLDTTSNSKMRQAISHTTPIPHSPCFRTAWLPPERNHTSLYCRKVTPQAA